MSYEAIKTICLAEEEAHRLIQLAKRNAREAVESTEKAGKEAVANTLSRAETEIAHLTHAIDHKATQEAKELASTTANRQATLHARAQRRLNDAATLIVERIVNAQC